MSTAHILERSLPILLIWVAAPMPLWIMVFLMLLI